MVKYGVSIMSLFCHRIAFCYCYRDFQYRLSRKCALLLTRRRQAEALSNSFTYMYAYLLIYHLLLSAIICYYLRRGLLLYGAPENWQF